MEEWEDEKEGLLVLGPANQFGWLRLPDNSSIFETAEDPSAGPTAGHYELIFTVSCDLSSLCFVILRRANLD